MNTGPGYPVGPFLANLRNQVPIIEGAWRDVVGERQGEFAEVGLFLPTEHATPVALMLYTLDLETRRAVEIIRNEFRPPSVRRSVSQTFRPVPLRDGGLSLSSAEIGSADLLLVAFGAVSQMLLSDPVQLTLTVKELLGWGDKLVVRIKRQFDPAPQVVWPTGGFRVGTTPEEVSVDRVPPKTRVRVKHVSIDGTETTIEIERS